MEAILGVIFDLDGVLVSTDECHYQAWKAMADREGIPFGRQDNERLRGVSRMDSLEIVLEKAARSYSQEEKQALAQQKNDEYVRLIASLSPRDRLPGATQTVQALKGAGIRVAIGSSSRNTPVILRQIGWEGAFDAVADGNQISRSKPDPEVFLLAARLLGLRPESCLVVEDADSGVEAALAGGMRVLGVGSASANPRATLRAKALSELNLTETIDKINQQEEIEQC